MESENKVVSRIRKIYNFLDTIYSGYRKKQKSILLVQLLVHSRFAC